jgi:para-aminobenzoate synthetase/4-amino-4-deoxychorismate lyase
MQAGGARRDTSWLEFYGLQALLVARQPSEVVRVLETATEAARQGTWAAGFVTYEAAPAFDPALQTHPASDLPLAWFGLFAHHRVHDRFAAPLDQPPPPCAWTPGVTADQHRRAVTRIRDFISAGDTYQVNYTFRLRTTLQEAPQDFAARLFARQATGYAAFIEAPEFTFCSASPELFFARDDGHILCRPMKGTAPRGMTLQDDRLAAARLQQSEKDKAENIMIVDMVRNDLGRIARHGSVQVSCRFDIERYDTLWQMTSTVEALSAAPLPDIFRALFPSASVTGAPKVRTMQIIADLETAPRGIYCGSIGYLAPDGRASFNVAIRTVHIDPRTSAAAYGTGSGIVWDSNADNEYRECATKAMILNEDTRPFELLETIAWRPGDGYALLDAHLQRMGDSAEYFGYAFDASAVFVHLDTLALSFTEPQRVRLLLDRAGAFHTSHEPLSPSPQPLRLVLDSHPVDSTDRFLYHKTTRRAVYERARARHPDADDVVLVNERGEITESTIANVAARLDGKWFTPPVACGLLPGVERAELLRAGRLRERVITREEFLRAEDIAIFNSVRDWMPCKLL